MIALLAVLATASAAKPMIQPSAAANASDIPALAKLLEDAGWTPTPELSSGFRPGDIFRATDTGHVLEGSACFEATPRESDYTQVELVSSLQGGVSMKLAPGIGASVEAGLVKKLKFSTPMHAAIEGFDLVPTADCLSSIGRLVNQGKNPGSRYAVREVLSAQIAEQTCGRIDAEGRFAMLGQADMQLEMACAQASLEPVAVGYRTEPVLSLQGVSDLVGNATANIGMALPLSAAGGGWQDSLQRPVAWVEIEDLARGTVAGDDLLRRSTSNKKLRNTSYLLSSLGFVGAGLTWGLAGSCANQTTCNKTPIVLASSGWGVAWGGVAALAIVQRKGNQKKIVETVNRGAR
jgi:hypothetical protein